jgi:hypothetical protein
MHRTYVRRSLERTTLFKEIRQRLKTDGKRADIIVLVAWLLTNFLDDGQLRSPSGARRKKDRARRRGVLARAPRGVTAACTESGSPMNLKPVSASLHPLRRACVACKTMTLAEKRLADCNGRAIMDYYCWFCAPQLKGCCDLRADVFEKPAAQQMALSLTS